VGLAPGSGPPRIPAWHWVIAGLVLIGAALAGWGAMQTWLRVTVRPAPVVVREGEAPGDYETEARKLLDSIFAAAKRDEAAEAAILAAQTLPPRTFTVEGPEAYGRHVLTAAALALGVGLLDLLRRWSRSTLPGFVYLLLAAVPITLIALDLWRLRSLAEQETWLGLDVFAMVQGIPNPLPSLTVLRDGYLVAAGLAVLLAASLLRLLLPLAFRPVARQWV
jgi:hypothetical protein